MTVSPLPSLRAIVERAVTVADVVTAPLMTLASDERASDAAAALLARDFTIAGVAGDPIVAYVARSQLETSTGSVGDVSRPILAADTIEKATPLKTLIETLGTRPHVFVLDDDRVRWLLTQADLQAPAVGVVTLAYLVAIETGIAPLVVHHLGPSWFERLPMPARRKAIALFETKRTRDQATSLEDCLYFSDWMKLASRSEALVSGLGYGSRSAFTRMTGGLADVRNALAHGGTLLDHATSEKAIRRFKEICRLAERVWDLADDLDERWELYLATDIRTSDGARLTGPSSSTRLLIDGPVHIITAWNPDSITRSPKANREANSALEQLLRAEGHDALMVVGSSPDETWQEESLLVKGVSRREAARLGEQFGQSAVFELGDETLAVVRCRDGRIVRQRDRRT
jgi:hypothetical protein